MTLVPLTLIETVGSTSDVLKAAADAGLGEQALLARRQTAGRGRLGRVWQSVEGNMALSVLLRPGQPIVPGHWSLLSAVALHGTAARFAERPEMLRLKWPNDVMLGDGKLGGLLLEAGADAQGGPWLVIGAGVNLVAAPADLGRAVASLATCAPLVTPEAFARLFLDLLVEWRGRYEGLGFGPVREAWMVAGPALGSLIVMGDGRTAGVFAGIADDGALLVEGPGGIAVVTSGEVADPTTRA